MTAYRKSRTAAAIALPVLLTAILQWRSGAYSSDLATNSDEPAHVVSGLMVHDYAARLLNLTALSLPVNPRAFAEAYYVHYPKVAIGHWPPSFYLIQAAWMLIVGRTKFALLLLMLSTVAATAVFVRLQVRRITASEIAAVCATLIFLILPITQLSLASVMPDAFLGLLTGAAIIATGRMLRREPYAWTMFWAIAIASVSIHARGGPVLMVAWLAIAISGATARLKDRGLWLGTALCTCLALPWLLFVHQATRVSLALIAAKIAAFPLHAAHAFGFLPAAMALLGVFVAPYRKEPFWVAVHGTVLANYIFFSVAIVPWADRYFVALLPACILLTSGAWHWLALQISARTGFSRAVVTGVLALCTTIPCVLRGFPLVHSCNDEYEEAAKQVMAGDAKNTVFLIAGDSICEGAFVSAVALLDDPGRHIVLRSTKVLAKTDWSMSYYELLFRTPQEVAAFLATSPVSFVILQGGLPAMPHVALLRDAVRQTPSWIELTPSPNVRIYRRTLPLPVGPVTIRLDMRDSLNRFVEWTQ